MTSRRTSSWVVAVAVALGASVSAAVPAAAEATTPPSDDGAPIELPTASLELPTRPTQETAAERVAPTGRRSKAPGQRCDQPVVTDRIDRRAPFDVLEQELTGDCSTWTLTTRLRKPLDMTSFGTWTMEIDFHPRIRGCRGTDRLVYVIPDNGRLRGTVYSTPNCDTDTWTALGTATVRRPDRSTIRVTFDGFLLGDVAGFRWWAAVDARRNGGFDAAPNSGWVTAKFAPPPPRALRIQPMGIGAYEATWQDVDIFPTTYTATLRRIGGPTVDVRVTSQTSKRLDLEGLTAGRYVLSVIPWMKKVRGEAATTSFTIAPVTDVTLPSPVTPASAGATSATEPADHTSAEQADGSSPSATSPGTFSTRTAARAVPSSCNQPQVNDGGGDGTIDIASVAITSNCRDIRFVITTRQPFQDWQLRRLGIAVGRVGDKGASTCNGMSQLVLVEPSGGVLRASLHDLLECTYYPGSSLTLERLAPNSLAITVSRQALRADSSSDEVIRWQVFTIAASDGSLDAAPGLPAAFWDAAASPSFVASSSADGRTIDIAMDPGNISARARGYEVRHRRPGGRWSRPQRVAFNDHDVSIPGLKPGTYEISVTAMSVIGGDKPRVRTVVHRAPPGSVEIVSVTMVRGRPTITIDLPDGNSGYARPRATISAITDSGDRLSVFPVNDTTFRLLTLPDEPFTVYTMSYGTAKDRTTQYGDMVPIRITLLPPT